MVNKAGRVSLTGQTQSASSRKKTPRRGPPRAAKRKKGAKNKRKHRAKTDKAVTVAKGRVRLLFPSGRRKTVAAATLVRHIAPATVLNAAAHIGKRGRRR